jgi:hypothetical protein
MKKRLGLKPKTPLEKIKSVEQLINFLQEHNYQLFDPIHINPSPQPGLDDPDSHCRETNPKEIISLLKSDLDVNLKKLGSDRTTAKLIKNPNSLELIFHCDIIPKKEMFYSNSERYGIKGMKYVWEWLINSKENSIEPVGLGTHLTSGGIWKYDCDYDYVPIEKPSPKHENNKPVTVPHYNH